MKKKIVYFVHCVDTEGPLYESLTAKFQRVKDIFNISVKPSRENLKKLKLAKIPLKGKEKKIASNKNVVMDGRDIGTVVIYDAEIKFFIEADLHIRAQRRFDQAQDESLTIKKVIENLNFRDNEDMLRENSPLKKAKDSIVLNNTNINFEQLKNQAFNIIRKKNEVLIINYF